MKYIVNPTPIKKISSSVPKLSKSVSNTKKWNLHNKGVVISRKSITMIIITLVFIYHMYLISGKTPETTFLLSTIFSLSLLYWITL